MTLLQRIQAIVAASCPGYGFEYETQKMMNERADDKAFPCVFFDEYYTETDDNTSRFGDNTVATVNIHFLKLADFQCDAVLREAIRQEIKTEALLPFVDAAKASGFFKAVRVIDRSPEPPLFDANAVGILLRIQFTYPTCLDR